MKTSIYPGVEINLPYLNGFFQTIFPYMVWFVLIIVFLLFLYNIARESKRRYNMAWSGVGFIIAFFYLVLSITSSNDLFLVTAGTFLIIFFVTFVILILQQLHYFYCREKYFMKESFINTPDKARKFVKKNFPEISEDAIVNPAILSAHVSETKDIAGWVVNNLFIGFFESKTQAHYGHYEIINDFVYIKGCKFKVVEKGVVPAHL